MNAATGARGLDRDGAERRFGTYRPFAAQSCAPPWPACVPLPQVEGERLT